MTATYKTGQITLANGSAAVTGVGTAWATMLIAGGIIFPVVGGNPLAIQDVVSDTSITAEKPWAGVSGTYDYVLVRWSADEEQNSVNSTILATIYAELQAGSLWKYDVAGSSADRSTYSERPKGFSYLVIDVNPAQLYIKASATSADWAGPFAYATGPQGPVGPAGYVNLRGTYSAATAYEKNDGVLYNGSSFVALKATTGNAPPTLPTTSDANWQLLAIKGTDGAGTGDVVGPSGTTDDVPAFFDGTTGKLLKAKSKAAFKTWLATSATDVSFDNSTANLSGSPATVQAAINSLAANTGGGKNDALFALEIADLKGIRMGMVGGIADSFDDETGINTGSSVNQSYNAANDWYAPTSSTTMIPQATGTAIGNLTSNGGLAAAFDGVTSQATTACARTATNTATTGYVGKNYTGAAKQIGSATIYGSSDTGLDGTNTASTITLVLRGKNGSAPSSQTDGTSLGTASFSDASAVTQTITSTDQTTAWDYVWLDITTTASSGVYVAEAQFYAPTTSNNMTLLSVSYTATAVPSTARVAVQLADALTLTPNTDFTMEVSRNGGTSWTTAVLALTMPLFGGVKMYEATVTVSGQASGTSMMWRFKTLTNKAIIVSGVVLQQS